MRPKRWAALLTVLILLPASAMAAEATTSQKMLAAECEGPDGPAANASPGSAARAVLDAFSVLDRPAAAAPPPQLTSALAHGLAGSVVSFDPTRLRLLKQVGQDDFYLLPATLRHQSTASACFHVNGLTYPRAVATFENLARGSGAGVCLVVTAEGSGTVEGNSCLSAGALDTYGAYLMTYQVSAHDRVMLVPDGVATVRLSFASGRAYAYGASHNLASITLTFAANRPNPSLREAEASGAKDSPTLVNELSADGTTRLSFTRPAAALPATAELLLTVLKLVTIQLS